MGYYPPLTDYLADWRMDQIKGEDLQDPTARLQISALSTSVNSLSQQVTTLSVSVANKVSKSGDTMTGDLTMDNGHSTDSPSIIMKDKSYGFSIGEDGGYLKICSGVTVGNYVDRYRFRNDELMDSPHDIARANSLIYTWTVVRLDHDTKEYEREYLLVRDFTYDGGATGGKAWIESTGEQYPSLSFAYETSSASPDGTWTFTDEEGHVLTTGDEDAAGLLVFSISNIEWSKDYMLIKSTRSCPVQAVDMPQTFQGTLTLTTGTVTIYGSGYFEYAFMLAAARRKVSLHLYVTELQKFIDCPLTAYTTTYLYFGLTLFADLSGSGTSGPISGQIWISATGSTGVNIAPLLNKSGDTMQGDLSIGGLASGESHKLYFPEGNSDPSSQNFIGWKLENDYGFFELSSLGYSVPEFFQFRESFKEPNSVMISQHFCNTWRGAAFMNGNLALKFQMEGRDVDHDYYVKGPEQDSTPVTRLSWDNDQSFWQLTTTMRTFQLAGSISDTFLQFGATVQGVRYDVYLFKNVGNAIVLPTDIPLIVNATIDTQTGAVTFDQQWDQVAYQAMMGRVIHVRTTVDGCTHEIPLTFADPTSYCLSFSGIYNTDGAAMVPRQLTILWSANPNVSSGARSYILANDDTVEALVNDVSTLSTSVSTLNTSVTTLSKGYPVVVPTKSITSGTDAVTATNRAVTSLSYVAADSVTAVNLTFPSINSGFSRDFILYIDFAPNNLVVNLPVSGVTFIVPEGENLSDMTTIDSGAAANIYFSEVKANTFAVHRVTFEAAV